MYFYTLVIADILIKYAGLVLMFCVIHEASHSTILNRDSFNFFLRIMDAISST